MFTKILIGIICLAHVGIFALETFLWTAPFVQEKFHDFTPEQLAAILAANQGLYNAFLAAGLVWGLLDKQKSLSILSFFLTCIAIAGVYGSYSLGRPTALLIQTAPAVIALLLLLVVNRSGTKAASSYGLANQPVKLFDLRKMLMNILSDKWQKLIGGLAVALILLLQIPSPAHAQSSDPPCIHGMRIVGEQSVYLSHMGLFNNSCHDYQGIFEVSLEGANNPQQIYLDAQKKDANQNEFTIEPTQKSVLPEFAAGKLTSFKADIYSGQYERSATKPKLLASDVTVKLKRVLYFRQFKAGAKQPAKSEYLLFGTGAEQLAAHLITAPPDFDQVVALKSPLPLTDTELAKAVRLVLPNRPTPDSTANLKQALKLGDKPAVQVNGQQPNKTIETGIQYFLETADYKA